MTFRTNISAVVIHTLSERVSVVVSVVVVVVAAVVPIPAASPVSVLPVNDCFTSPAAGPFSLPVSPVTADTSLTVSACCTGVSMSLAAAAASTSVWGLICNALSPVLTSGMVVAVISVRSAVTS